MKLVIFLGLLATAAIVCARSTDLDLGINLGTDDVRRRPESEHLIPLGNALHNAKKLGSSSIGSGYRSGDDSCAMTCVSQLGSLMQDAELADYFEKQSKPFRFEDRFNPVYLRKYCSKIEPIISCIQPCSTGVAKSVGEAALSLPKFICKDSQFMQKAQCIHKVYKENKATCDNKCSSKKSTLERTMRSQPATMRDILTLLSNTCEYMDCDVDCDVAKVRSECGADGAKLYVDYFKKSIEAMDKMFQSMGIEIATPSQCYSIGSGD